LLDLFALPLWQAPLALAQASMPVPGPSGPKLKE